MPSPRIYLSPPHMSGREQDYIRDVFEQNWIAPVGPHLKQFEERFAEVVGVSDAAAVASGTAALHLALRHVGIAPGDEVVCSTFSFCASANPILYEGASPVFIDSDLDTWNLDPNLLEEELSESAARGKLPRAIVAVDILGQSADIDAINEIAARYGIPVIEDAAEALGATYHDRPVGSASWASVFSFNGNKIITTSGGGMLCSNDNELIEGTRFLATQAKDPGPIYHHSHVGFNYRMSNVLAAIGIAQLEVLPERVERRRAIADFYASAFAETPGIRLMPEAVYGRSNRWLSVVLVDPTLFGASCEQIRLHLETKNIESRRVWLPLHKQPVYHGSRCRGGQVSESLFDQSLCLPSGSALTDDDLRYIVASIQETPSQIG